MKSRPENRFGKTKKTRGRRAPVKLLIALVILGIATIAMFTLPRNSSQAKPKKFRATREIVLDKSTGRTRKPTSEETELMVAQISSLTNRSTEGLTVQPSANGGEMMDLEDASAVWSWAALRPMAAPR